MSDSSGDEDSPSRRLPALVVSSSLVSKVQSGSHLTTKDRLDLVIYRQLLFYMQAVFNHLRKHLTTDGGAEALLAWANVQDSIDGGDSKFKIYRFYIVKLMQFQHRKRTAACQSPIALIKLINGPSVRGTSSGIPRSCTLPSTRKTWYKWYASLMPASRQTPQNWPLLRDVRPDETWSIMMQSGPNGLTILMMTLYWWSLTVGEFDSDLKFTLKDVAWVFETMRASDTLVAVRKRDQVSDLLSPSKALTTDAYRVVVKHTTSASPPRKHTRSSKQDMVTPVKECEKENDPSAAPSTRKAKHAPSRHSSKRART